MQRFTRAPVGARRPAETKTQFKSLRAVELYCPRCKRAMPVRERLLLALPEGDKFEYLCARCGASVGDRIEKGEQKPILVIP